MSYISPLRFLNLDPNTTLDKASLNLAKKKILAEMELSTQGTIELGGQTMTKNDVLQWFDSLGKTKDWTFHQAIAQDKALLDFLEKSELYAPYTFLNQAIYSDEAFIEFVSPYFSENYKENCIEYLRIGEPTFLSNVLGISPLLMTEYDKYEVWQALEIFIDHEIEGIEDIEKEIETTNIAKTTFDLAPLHDKNFIACMNVLPDYFFAVRDRYARALYNLSAVQWNAKGQLSATALVKDSVLLNVYAETQTMLQERLTWFASQQQKQTASTSSDSDSSWSGVGKLIFYILIVVFNIGRLGRGCGESSPSYNRYTPTFEYNPRTGQYDYSTTTAPSETTSPDKSSVTWANAYLKKPQEDFDAFLKNKNKLNDEIAVHKIAKYQGTLYTKSPMGRLSSKNQALAKRISSNLQKLRAATTKDQKYLNALTTWFMFEVNTKGTTNLEDFPMD
jgi:hypothetical protein